MQNKYKYEKILITEDNVNKYYTVFAHTHYTRKTISTQLYHLCLPLVFSSPLDAKRYISDFGLNDRDTQCFITNCAFTGEATLCTYIGFKRYSAPINKLLSTSKYTPILGEYYVNIGIDTITIQFEELEFELYYSSYNKEFMYCSFETSDKDSEDMIAIARLMKELNDIVCEA